jgi:hypothetical protein
MHDSVNDARAAVNAAVYAAHHINSGIQPIIRSGSIPNADGSLLVHRIPDFCTNEHIENMFQLQTFILPNKITVLNTTNETSGLNTGPNRKLVATFLTPQHASLAFDSIVGEAKPDKSGRAQKRVYLKDGGYIYIRKY